jgi:predicted nucleic acid-binding protein
MAVDPQYLVDNSAWNRLKYESVAARVKPLLDAGLVATCGALEIEALYSARNWDDYERLQGIRASIFTYLETAESDLQRALSVQKELARNSQHRGIKIPDLLIAAIAERYAVTLLHYDSDFDRIATITGQPVEWVVPRDSIA